MIAPTHMTFSLFVYLLLMTPTGIALSWVNALVATLASLLPDLDTQSSAIGKRLRFISRPLEARFGHRTITHSLAFIAGLFVLLLPLVWWRADLYYCFCVGYATHPLLDTATINGVSLFYPVSGRKCVFPMDVNHPHRYRVQTGSRSDIILGVAFLLASLPAYLVAREGYERFVRITQGSIESAVRDYNDMSRTHRVHADIRAHNLVTKRSLNGRFELLGSIDNHTLLFREEDGTIRTLGLEYQSDYAADRIIAERGEEVRTTVHSIDVAGQRLKDLSRVLHHDSGTLLFGTLAVDRDVAISQAAAGFQPIECRPGSIRLAFATVREVTEAGLGDVLVLRGVLTVRQVSAISDSARAGERPGTRELSALPWQTRTFTLAAGKGEQILQLHREGDSVSVGDTLALRTSSPATHDLLEALHEDLRRLSGELNAREISYYERLGEIREKRRRDSLDLLLAISLQAAGFSSRVSIEAKRVDLARRTYQRERLKADFRRTVDRLQGQIADIEGKIRQVQRADSISHTALLSPVGGTIRSVRYLEQGGGRQAVISIEVPGVASSSRRARP